MTKKVIVLTMGDPDGIGPEIICKALLSTQISRSYHYVIVGSCSVFEKISSFRRVMKKRNISFCQNLNFNLATRNARRATRRAISGQLSLDALQTSVALIKSGQAQALVTAPICKEHVKSAGFKFPGHTEYLCHEFDVQKFAMMFVAPQLRVVLSTIHVPLRDVPKMLTIDLINEKLILTADALVKKFGIKHPRIAVCGLNPHASEHGLMGNEEQRIIIPAIKKFMRSRLGSSVDVKGPVPANAVFVSQTKKPFDAILCHYHDQGLVPIKLLACNSAVNLTLGLPFIRTSPAHGTAFDIAGKNKANPQSMIEAIRLAGELTRS